MKYLYIFFALSLISCSDSNSSNEYALLTELEIEAALTISKDYPFEYKLRTEDDSISISDTITYSITDLVFESAEFTNTESLSNEANYDPENAVVTSQTIQLSFKYSAVEGVISEDSTFIFGTDTVFVTQAQFDSVYTANAFDFTSLITSYTVYNFNTDINIEKVSRDIFKGAVMMNNLIYLPSGNPAPVDTRLFNIYDNKVVFGGYMNATSNAFQRDLADTLATTFEINF